MLQHRQEIERDAGQGTHDAPRAAPARVEITEVLSARGSAIASYAKIREIALRRGLAVPQTPDRVSAWHTWELVALLCGVAPEVAAQGRDAFLRAEIEGWPQDATHDFRDAVALLNQAKASPETSYWTWLASIMRHSPASQIG